MGRGQESKAEKYLYEDGDKENKESDDNNESYIGRMIRKK